jgi:hypothetical protein
LTAIAAHVIVATTASSNTKTNAVLKGVDMRRLRIPVLVLLCLLLVALPSFLGCGSKESTTKEIKYGWIWDFTGRASSGVTQTYVGFKDYLRMVREEDPIPGVKISLEIYDTQSDAAKVPLGYDYMKGQSVDIMSAAPQDTELLRSRFESDQIPFYALSNIKSMVDCQWLTSLYGPPELQIEAELEWISQNWDGYPTKPKVGFIGLAGVSFYVSQEATVREWVLAHPDDFDWLGSSFAPSTVSSWALEIEKYKKADFIFASMSGPPLVSLLEQARAKGYSNTFMGPSETWFSFYMLLRAGVSPANLDNVIAGTYTPWWGDSGSFMDEVEKYAQKYHSADELTTIHQGTGQFNGWAAGMIFVDAVRRAVKEVGAENLDGIAIHNALKETDLSVPGWGNTWKLPDRDDVNYFAQTVRLVEYKSDIDNWVAITDFMYPPSMRT